MSGKDNMPITPHKELGEIKEVIRFDINCAILTADIVCFKRHEGKNWAHLRNGQCFAVDGSFDSAVRKWKAAILAGQP